MTVRFGRLVEGGDPYTGDLSPERVAHLVLVRSTVAHARLARVETRAAASCPGVVGVFTAADLDALEVAPVPPIYGGARYAQPPLARDVVRWVGEPVVAIVAESVGAGMDAAELVEIDYDELPVVLDARAAAGADAPLLFPETGTNVVLGLTAERAGNGDPADDAPVRVRLRCRIPRVAVAPMEGHAVLAAPDPDGSLTAWVSTQAPHAARGTIAASLGRPVESVRVIAPRAGGGFGGKAGPDVPEYAVVAAAAVALGRPVRYVEPRSANLVRMQGRGVHQEVELRADRDGRIRSLQIDVTADAGAFPGIGTIEPGKMKLMATGPYRVPSVEFAGRSVLTNHAPTGAYRGPGRSEAASLLERALDVLAAELALDPAEVRRRNLLTPAEFPYATPTGMPYDAGDYPRLLEALLARTGYDALRSEQHERRAQGSTRLLGLGIATVVDSTAWAARQEEAVVALEADGTVTVTIATAGAGQEHAIAFAQLVAAVLPVAVTAVRVREGDTADLPVGFGSSGSRTAQIGGSAVHLAATELDGRLRAAAAELLEASVDDVVAVPATGYAVRGVPSSVVAVAAIAARLAATDPSALETRCTHAQTDPTHPAAAHLAVVEVDAETGQVTLLRHVAVTDAGRLLDPPSADGQVIGATVQGIGQALYEEAVHDEHGTPLTATFADYLAPSAADVPPIESLHLESVSPMNPLGAKGIGEIGMVAAPVAVQNAVVDALAHLGVRHVDLPLSPERVWRAITTAPVHSS